MCLGVSKRVFIQVREVYLAHLLEIMVEEHAVRSAIVFCATCRHVPHGAGHCTCMHASSHSHGQESQPSSLPCVEQARLGIVLLWAALSAVMSLVLAGACGAGAATC